jgi:hypothetical protein
MEVKFNELERVMLDSAAHTLPAASKDRFYYLVSEQMRPRGVDLASVVERALNFYGSSTIEVRFTPKATQLLRGSEMTRWAKSRLSALQQNSVLFDHFVGAGNERSWKFEAECLRGPEIDH